MLLLRTEDQPRTPNKQNVTHTNAAVTPLPYRRTQSLEGVTRVNPTQINVISPPYQRSYSLDSNVKAGLRIATPAVVPDVGDAVEFKMDTPTSSSFQLDTSSSSNVFKLSISPFRGSLSPRTSCPTVTRTVGLESPFASPKEKGQDCRNTSEFSSSFDESEEKELEEFIKIIKNDLVHLDSQSSMEQYVRTFDKLVG